MFKTKYYITEKELFLLAKFYDGSDLLLGNKNTREQINLADIFLLEFLPKKENYIFILLEALKKIGINLKIKFNKKMYETLKDNIPNIKFSDIRLDRKWFLIDNDIIGTVISLEQLLLFYIDKKEYEKTIVSLKEKLGIYLKKNFSGKLKIKTKNYLNFNESKEVLFNKIKEKGYIEKISNEFVLESDFNKNNEFLMFHTVFTMYWFLDYFSITKYFIEEKNVGGIRIKIKENFLLDYNKKFNLKNFKNKREKKEKKILMKIKKTDKNKYLITINNTDKIIIENNRSDSKMWCMLYEIAKNGLINIIGNNCNKDGYENFVKNINNPSANKLKRELEEKGISDKILIKEDDYAKPSNSFEIKVDKLTN